MITCWVCRVFYIIKQYNKLPVVFHYLIHKCRRILLQLNVFLEIYGLHSTINSAKIFVKTNSCKSFMRILSYMQTIFTWWDIQKPIIKNIEDLEISIMWFNIMNENEKYDF